MKLIPSSRVTLDANDTAIHSVYTLEIAPTSQRGFLSCMTQLLVTIGIAAAHFTAYASVELEGSIAWRVPFIVQAYVGVVLAGGIFFIPFSPRWLTHKGRGGGVGDVAEVEEYDNNCNRTRNTC